MTDMYEDVERRLLDAGLTLMMLPMPASGMPADAGAAWPDVLQGFWDQAGVADQGSVEERLEALAQVHNATTLHASREAITRLDEVLGWLLTIERTHYRRVVFARMLVHPVSERRVHSWTEIGKMLGASRGSVRNWHARGVQAILEGLAAAV